MNSALLPSPNLDSLVTGMRTREGLQNRVGPRGGPTAGSDLILNITPAATRRLPGGRVVSLFPRPGDPSRIEWKDMLARGAVWVGYVSAWTQEAFILK